MSDEHDYDDEGIAHIGSVEACASRFHTRVLLDRDGDLYLRQGEDNLVICQHEIEPLLALLKKAYPCSVNVLKRRAGK